MNFNLENIISRTNQDGAPIQTAHFSVKITSPPIMQGTQSEFMSFYIAATNLPGLVLELQAVKRHGYGLVENRPVSVSFNSINLSVLLDGKTETARYFQKWFEGISKFRNGGQDSGYALYSYPDQYESTVIIDVYDAVEQKQLSYKLHNAYPYIIGDVGMDWSASNQFTYLPVTFIYKKYTIEDKTESNNK